MSEHRRHRGDLVTAERLREVLSYCPESGVFTWINSKGAAKAGSRAGTLKTDGYCEIWIDGRAHLAHRLAWLYVHGRWPPNELDHRDRYRANNRIANLRESTRSQNAANSGLRHTSKSRVKGVTWHKASRRWFAQVFKDGVSVSKGYFRSIDEAKEFYVRHATAAFGEFACPTGLDAREHDIRELRSAQLRGTNA